VTGTGGEGSARRHLNRGEKKMGTAGPAQAHGKGRRGGGVGVRGGGAWSGTNPGATDAGSVLCGNREGRRLECGPRWGRLLGRLLWAWPSE
jgi:hypothetical protein